MRYLSLFSGIGGFDIAFTQVGMECVGMCEIDKNAQEVLRKNFPGVEIYDDVKEVGSGTHERGAVDLICGGFPCQDLSIAGKRAGLAGERSGLWYEFARIIDELEPGWVVIENVPGLLSSDKGRDFAIILRWLVERGYGVSWRVLDAQYFGVPQRRRRVFVVASFGSGRSAEVLFECEGMFGDIAKGRKSRETSPKTFTIRIGKEGGGKGYLEASSAMTLGGQPQYLETVTRMTAFGEYVEDDTASAIKQRDWKDATDLVAVDHSGGATLRCFGHGCQGQHNDTNSVIAFKANDSEDSGGVFPSIDISPTLSGAGGGNKLCVTSPSIVSNGDAHSGFRDLVWEMQHASEAYRETQGGVAPTLQQRMGTGGNNVPLVGVRRLTPTECARLQGFPDDWNDWMSDSARYRQFGNAVAVPVVKWIAERIMKVA